MLVTRRTRLRLVPRQSGTSMMMRCRTSGPGTRTAKSGADQLGDIETSLDEVDAYAETILRHLGGDPSQESPPGN
jgi:hypothetical protein